MENFLLLAGNKGSGKGLIRGLLDGHPQLFVSPYHELIFQSFFGKGAEYDIESFRTFLASNGGYYQLERLFYEEQRNVHIAAGIKDQGIDIDFDFYSFDRSWVKSLMSKKNVFSSEEVCREIYRSFHCHLNSKYLTKSKKVNYFCSMSGDDFDSIPLFIETFTNSKVIHIKRNLIESISSIIGRQPSKLNSRSKKLNRDKLINTYATYDYVSSMVRFNIEAEKAAKRYPSQILIVDFHDFFRNRFSETKRIVDFLKIKNSESLEFFSNTGFKFLNPDGTSLLESPVDTGHSNLSVSEVTRITEYIKEADREFST